MAEVVAKIRDKTGTGPSRAYRQANLVPAVLYGEGVEAPVHLLVDKLELERLLGAHGLGSIVTVKVPDQADYPAMVKDVQYHPVRGQVIHADFQGISLTKTLRTVVPIVLHGTPHGVDEGGTVQHQLRELEVECLPQDLPDHIVAEVSDLGLTESLFVRDLAVPEKVEILTDRDEVIVTVLAPRPEEEEEEVEEEAVDEGVAVPEAEAEKAADKDEE
ncbi:MAG: 50S ribosomal protein L25 [bacterium]|jgi:large subunit ribosomal protein L25|nr:50S ribosomal protein L25 [Bacillota bacterium]